MLGEHTGRTIFHLLSRAEWAVAQHNGVHAPDTLARFGFLHCCRATQVAFVLGRHFPNGADLLVLEIDPARTDVDCRWENSEPDQDSFPHLYGALPLSAVVRVLHQSDFVP